MSLDKLKYITERQANLECLWHAPNSLNELILQYALRHLHAVIENDKQMAAFYKSKYWEIENEC